MINKIKKNKKMFIMILIFIVLIMFLNDWVYASDIGKFVGTEPTPGVKNSVNGVVNAIVTVFSTVGSILSVLVLVIIGIKYMVGSIEERAEYKKNMMPYVIGASLVFASSTIAGIVYNMAIRIR